MVPSSENITKALRVSFCLSFNCPKRCATVKIFPLLEMQKPLATIFNFSGLSTCGLNAIATIEPLTCFILSARDIELNIYYLSRLLSDGLKVQSLDSMKSNKAKLLNYPKKFPNDLHFGS